MGNEPGWVAMLPVVNATLNGLAGVLLLCGYTAVRRGRHDAHRRLMLTAFAVSVVFLTCYLVYHVSLYVYTGSGSKKFPADHPLRSIYLLILITHVVLAAIVPVLAIVTIRRGLKQDWTRHKRIARWTLPIWLYVSVTGVIIYALLYHVARP